MLVINRKLQIASKNAILIIKYLNFYGGESRIIGGYVRDSLSGVPSSDIDIATSHPPEKVIKILDSFAVKNIPTGIKFGTITAIIKGEKFEITTLRKDKNCDGRYATIEYSDSFEEDSARRDFTINALSYCPIKEQIYDYFDGLNDLENKRVKFIGKASSRIKEDYLRILRFFRFSARYAKKIDDLGLKSCIKYKSQLRSLSKERIKSEIDSLLLCHEAANIMQIMFDKGVLSEILPITQYNANMHKEALNICKKFNVNPSIELLYSTLFYQIQNVNIASLLELKFSKKLARNICKMLDLAKYSSKSELTYELKNIWLEEKFFLQYFVFALLVNLDNSFIFKLLKELINEKVPIFPVSGKDLILMGYSGSDIGKTLDLLKRKWIETNFIHKKSTLIKFNLENEK